MGLNELHTLLNKAVQQQNFSRASELSECMQKHIFGEPSTDLDEQQRRRLQMSWLGLGAAPWLVNRLDLLNYTLPTTIQINSMRAVNEILNATDLSQFESASLEARIDLLQKDLGLVISGATGSGKSLAYLVPLLSTLTDSLFARQRLRIGAEEEVGDSLMTVLERVALVKTPEIRSRVVGNAPGVSLASLGTSGKDATSPLALIVLPARELGLQVAKLLYNLVGGAIDVKVEEQVERGDRQFHYKGPKGVRIACVLDDEEAAEGLKLQTDIAITTPHYLGKLLDDKEVDPSKLRVIVYDEADLALENTAASDLSRLFDDDVDNRQYSRLSILVGASVTEALGNLAVCSRLLPASRSWIATASRCEQLVSSSSTDLVEGIQRDTEQASLQELDICLYPGLQHQRVIVRKGHAMFVLTQMLRQELRDYESKEQLPRVMVFFPTEDLARAAIVPLRDALWGQHKLCVLLPNTGHAPLWVLDQFQANMTTVMLATANSVRGLDFPALTHVYTLYLPVDNPREYVHLAGRVGRVGHLGSSTGDGGRVVSIVQEDEADKMDHLADKLGFHFEDIDAEKYAVNLDVSFKENEKGEIESSTVDVEKARRYLEDVLTLLGSSEEDGEGLDASEQSDKGKDKSG